MGDGTVVRSSDGEQWCKMTQQLKTRQAERLSVTSWDDMTWRKIRNIFWLFP